MERCANTEALNRHLAEQEKGETALENFFSAVENEIEELEDIITRIKNIAKDYEGYDFSDEIKDLVLEYV